MVNFFIPVNYDGNIFKYKVVILTYLCVIIFVWFEQDELEYYNLDLVSLLILVFIGFFRSYLIFPGEIFFRLPIYILSLILAGLIIKLRKKIPQTNISWLIIGGCFCLLVIPLAYIELLQPVHYLPYQSNFGIIFDGLAKFVYNLSFVAPFEEIAIRGLLWGQMRKWGWKEKSIFWIQAGLFWFLHIWKIGNTITFFVTIPITTLLVSFLVRYSRQLSPSILFHAFSNTFVGVIIYFILSN